MLLSICCGHVLKPQQLIFFFLFFFLFIATYIQKPQQIIRSKYVFFPLVYSDTAKGVISHPAPMETYTLIPPPADPLGSYVREKLRHWGTNPVKRPPYSSFQGPHGNTSVKDFIVNNSSYKVYSLVPYSSIQCILSK